MSWGKRILFVYIGFVAMIAFMIVRTMGEKVELVSGDYYQEELRFQQQIDRSNAVKELGAVPVITAGAEAIEILFPDTLMQQEISGKVRLYRPSDASKDVELELGPDADGRQLIPTDELLTGLYDIKLSWTSGGEEFYYERSIYIP
jgi:hypothetical protein